MTDSFGWLDIEFIGELLAEHYPQRDPMRIGFVELKKLVTALPGFVEDPKHPCNEKILEHIQAAWIMEKSNTPRNEDDD
ncbi:MAG: Fe-S cluster assembly protein IscX [Phycisphaerales bacterium]